MNELHACHPAATELPRQCEKPVSVSRLSHTGKQPARDTRTWLARFVLFGDSSLQSVPQVGKAGDAEIWVIVGWNLGPPCAVRLWQNKSLLLTMSMSNLSIWHVGLLSCVCSQ